MLGGTFGASVGCRRTTGINVNFRPCGRADGDGDGNHVPRTRGLAVCDSVSRAVFKSRDPFSREFGILYPSMCQFQVDSFRSEADTDSHRSQSHQDLKDQTMIFGLFVALAVLRVSAQDQNSTTVASSSASDVGSSTVAVTTTVPSGSSAAAACADDKCCAQFTSSCSSCQGNSGCQFCVAQRDPKKPIIEAVCKWRSSLCSTMAATTCAGDAASNSLALVALVVASVVATL